MNTPEYSKSLHGAAKKAGVFCKQCSYSFNGVLDDGCKMADCPEKKFESEFKKSHCHICGASLNNGRAGWFCGNCD